MKIALVWPLITSGEIEDYYNVQAYGMARALSEKGCEVTIFTANRLKHQTGFYQKKREKLVDNFRVVYLPVLGDSLAYPFMPSLFRELRNYLPDCIQCAELLSPSTYTAYLISIIYNIPLFIYQGTYTWPDKLKYLFKLLKPVLVAPMLKRCFAVFTKSEQTKSFMLGNGAIKSRTHVMHLGFNRDHYIPKKSSYLKDKYHIGSDRIILLCVGRLVTAKNQLKSIQAVRKLKDKIPDILLMIFGNGPMQNELEAYIKEKHLEYNIMIINDKIKQIDMPEVYASADIFLSPSRYEIFGMTVLEAMACGLPVIGSPVGGMKDVIVNGENGLLVRPESEMEIEEAVLLLLNNKSKYDSISANAVATSRLFSWHHVSEKMIPFFEHAIR